MASAKLSLRDGGLREHGRRERCLHDDTARPGTPVTHVLAERLDNQGLISFLWLRSWPTRFPWEPFELPSTPRGPPSRALVAVGSVFGRARRPTCPKTNTQCRPARIPFACVWSPRGSPGQVKAIIASRQREREVLRWNPERYRAGTPCGAPVPGGPVCAGARAPHTTSLMMAGSEHLQPTHDSRASLGPPRERLGGEGRVRTNHNTEQQRAP